MSTASRLAVARALRDVFVEGRRVQDGWNAGLSSEDARFSHALLGHCLRRWGRLQEFIRQNLSDPKRGIPVGSRIALATGIATLAWLPGVADHAAVDEAVQLAADGDLGFPPHRGLANAILRKLARERSGLAGILDALPWELDCPPFARWILEAALPAGGPSDRRALWQRLQAPPVIAFRALTSGDIPVGLSRDPSLPGAFLLQPEAPFPREWLAAGHAMVQDRTSQALMDFRWNRPVASILDVCAAPGGKTTTLGLNYPDAGIIALERSPARGRRLAQNLKDRGIQAQICISDAVTWLEASSGGFDLILLDAPCSGSGTLQKHPELAWIGSREEVARLSQQQSRLLRLAAGRLNPGGLLIHAVCSWFPEEGIAHLQPLLAEDPRLERVSIWDEVLSRTDGPAGLFSPDPLSWSGEGFQAFAVTKVDRS